MVDVLHDFPARIGASMTGSATAKLNTTPATWFTGIVGSADVSLRMPILPRLRRIRASAAVRRIERSSRPAGRRRRRDSAIPWTV